MPNPEHVDNLDTISKLEADGFTGMDASLSESIFEYGLAWRELPETKEILFVHRHPTLEKRFDRTSFKADLDFRKEFDWADFAGLCNFLGMTADEFDAQPLPNKIADLVSYSGEENVFGTSYWKGFKIADE